MSPGLPPGPGDRLVPGVVLVILDGWGIGDPGDPGNAVAGAETPVFDALWAEYPRTTLSTSGRDVGLPDGQMGNSEVGHLNLGAGAIVKQDLARIDDAVADGSFFENRALLDACRLARESEHGRLHLLALVSDGGVHSGWEHLEAAVELAADEGVPDLVVHAFTDGRDTLPAAGAGYVAELERWLRSAGRVGTVGGRYYAMDRDSRWERTKLAFDAIVHGQASFRAESSGQAIAAAYERGETDEFIVPTLIGAYGGAAADEPFLFANFRPDRARQLSSALGEAGFGEFDRTGASAFALTTMTRYREGWGYPVAFPPKEPEVTLAEVISGARRRQVHVAETEKYAHVTYFFNGGREAEWEGEGRRLVASPRDVPTYDLKPEMSAAAAADAFVEAWRAPEDCAFGIINFANPDMVGHTGDVQAAVKAIETVDANLAKIVTAAHESGACCLITADHGNAEQMREPDGSPNTAHSTNPVPFIATLRGGSLHAGILADVAPTVLELLGLAQPAQMTGSSLLDPSHPSSNN